MVSIDPSTKVTGMALFHGGELTTSYAINLSASKKDAEGRILDMGREIMTKLDEWNPAILYVEQPQGHGNNIRVARLISELIGFCKAWAVQNNAYIEEIPPSVWRKYLGLDQGGKKREQLKRDSMNAVLDVFGINVSEDESDAINIGSAMLQRYTE